MTTSPCRSTRTSPETRRTYAAVYRTFGAFLSPDAGPADLTPEAVRTYRDSLERAGRSPATVAKHLSALRGLADALGASDPALRAAIKGSTTWWVTVRYGKRGRTRAIPLDEDTLAAIMEWVKVRPTAATDHLLLSLPRTGQPPRPLGTRDIARTVERYATAAGLPEDRRSPHVLRHTFCTHLADSGADTAIIRELAGHADIRTTTIYTAVSDARLEHAIEARTFQRRGPRRAAAER